MPTARPAHAGAKRRSSERLRVVELFYIAGRSGPCTLGRCTGSISASRSSDDATGHDSAWPGTTAPGTLGGLRHINVDHPAPRGTHERSASSSRPFHATSLVSESGFLAAAFF